MFRNGVATAMGFTRPVVMSRRNIAGHCSAGIGAFIVVNDEGWIVTAAHIIQQLHDLDTSERAYAAHQAAVDAIRNDGTLVEKDRRKKLQAMGRLPPEHTTNAAAWFGGVASGLTNIKTWDAVDLAIGQLTGFDATKVQQYPRFKQPRPVFSPGASLCKLGFPFHDASPSWDAPSGSFAYPPGALDPPFFPMDGILARIQEILPVDAQGVPIPSAIGPLEVLETSTPGLRGQSGGPIFDVDGNIWAIQCVTRHMALGFTPPVQINGQQTVEHQFINLGAGPTSKTIIGALQSLGIKFQVAP